MKALFVVLSLSSFVLTGLGLQIDLQYIALAVGSSVAGSLMLAYIRPERTFWRQLVKGCMATIVGLIFGAAIIEYYAIEVPEYIGLVYFVASLLALIAIRALVGLFEQNATSFTAALIQRILNVPVEEGRSKKKSKKKEKMNCYDRND